MRRRLLAVGAVLILGASAFGAAGAKAEPTMIGCGNLEGFGVWVPSVGKRATSCGFGWAVGKAVQRFAFRTPRGLRAHHFPVTVAGQTLRCHNLRPSEGETIRCHSRERFVALIYEPSARMAPAATPTTITVEEAKAMIHREEPDAVIHGCHRIALTHIRCRVDLLLVVDSELIDEATGAVVEAAHPVSVTRIPTRVDVGLKGARWELIEEDSS